MNDQTQEVEWQDGDVPLSMRFQDPYYSRDNGLSETRHVFLGGNDLPTRFCDGFHIAELGFGTGLNLLAALTAWCKSNQTGRLHFTTFEAYPLDAATMLKAQASFPDVADAATDLRPFWQAGATEFQTESLYFKCIIGDARKTLTTWQGRADAWFLDGFSPARNPEMWEAGLMAQVGAHTAPGGTASTYTAAGFVRRGLEDAGFAVTRATGHGRKRHMTTARIPK